MSRRRSSRGRTYAASYCRESCRRSVVAPALVASGYDPAEEFSFGLDLVLAALDPLRDSPASRARVGTVSTAAGCRTRGLILASIYCRAPTTPEEAAEVIARAATLTAADETGTFIDANGSVAW